MYCKKDNNKNNAIELMRFSIITFADLETNNCYVYFYVGMSESPSIKLLQL